MTGPRTATAQAAALADELVSRPRALVKGTVERADRLAHAPQDMLHNAVTSVVTVNVEVNVDVASRSTRALEEASQAPARG